jgi:competence protein ComEC
MSCPLFVLALPFIAGLLLGAHRPWPPGFGALLLVLPLALGWRFFARNRLGGAAACALAASLALGAVVYSAAESRFSSNPLSRLPAYAYIDFYGTVDRSLAPGIDRDFLVLRVERIGRLGRELAADGRVRIAVARTSGSAARPDVLVGDAVKVSAQIVPPKEYRNFDEPFSRRYLRSQGFQALAATKSSALVTMVRAGPKYSPRRIVSRLRRSFLRRLEAAFAAADSPGGILPEGAVLEAFLLGERGRVGDDINRTLQETGLLHLLAISGAHIGIIAALLFGALRILGLSRRPASALLIVLLVLYGLLIEGQASVSRAVLMAGLYFAGGLLWKDVHLLNTLALSAFVILLDNPFQVFDMGFALTYAATLFILLFFEPLSRRLPRLPLKISDTLAMSLSAQAGVLPLVASSFHRITFSGLILNFLAIPIAAILLAAGYLFLPLSFLGPAVSSAGATVLGFLTDAFLWSTRLLEGQTGLSFRIPAPPLWASVGYWIALLLFLVPGRNRTQKAMTAASAGAFLLLLAFYPYPVGSDVLRLTFLDVGHGDSVLIEFPGREKMLVDGGGLPVGSFDIGESVVSPFLWEKGIRTIGTIVLSHPHPDHRNGLPAIARNFRPREFWEAAPGASDAGAETLLHSLGPAVHRRLVPGDERTIGGVRVEVLAPDEEDPVRAGAENERSLVLRLTYGSTSFLLAGDIDADAERRLIRSGRPLRTDVVKSPHHGSRSSSSPEFLEAVSPKIVVISVGRDNRYGLPDPGVVARYNERGTRILRTDRDGAVEIVSDGVRLSFRTAAAVRGND